MHRFLILVGLVLAARPAHAQENAQEGGLAVKQILQKHCHGCHGERGTVEGGLNYLLDLDLLVARKKVVPGKPNESLLLKRVQMGEMPPRQVSARPSAADIAFLKHWIETGATDFNPPVKARVPLTHDAVYELLWSDMKRFPERERRFLRYLTLHHLDHSGVGEDERETFRQGLAKAINVISWGAKVTAPVAIDARQSIFRIDLRDYRLSQRTWSMVAGSYPYFYHPRGDAGRRCVETVGGPVLMNADWFAAQALNPPLYYQLLRMPPTLAELEDELRINVDDNVKAGLALRAGFKDSGEATQPRLIERHESLFGAYWKTHDWLPRKKVPTLFEKPLTDLQPAWNTNTGHQVLFNLPNGLLAFVAADGQGRLLNSVDPWLTRDPRHLQTPIRGGIGCMSCHVQGVLIKDDQVRDHVGRNPSLVPPAESESFAAMFWPRDKSRAVMESDQQRFRQVVRKSGWNWGMAEPSVALALRYGADLSLDQAAYELGVAPTMLRENRDKTVTLKRLIAPLAEKGATMTRSAFAFGELARDLDLGETRAFVSLPTATVTAAHLTPPRGSPPALLAKSPTNPDPRPPLKVGMFRTKAKDHWLCEFPGHPGGIHAVALSPTDGWAAAETEPGKITLFDPASGKKRPPITGYKGTVLFLEFTPDGKTLAAATSASAVWMWDLAGGKLRATIEVKSGIAGLKFSPDGKWLATAGSNVRLWDANTGREKLPALPPRPDGQTNGLAFDATGAKLATAGSEICVWDLTQNKVLSVFTPRSTKPGKKMNVSHLGVAFSPDGATLATFFRNDYREGSTILMLEVAGKKVKLVLRVPNEVVKALAYTPDGKSMLFATEIYGSPASKVTRWDLEHKYVIATYLGHTSNIFSLAMTREGEHFATSGWDRTVRLWSVDPLQEAKPPLPLLPPIPGKKGASAETSITLKGRFEGHEGPILCLDSWQNRWAATGSADKTARLWDLDKGIELRRLEGHDGPVQGVAFAADSKTLFTASSDETLRQWDLASGKWLKTWNLKAAVSCLKLDARRTRLLVGVAPNELAVIDLVKSVKRRLAREVQGAVRLIELSPDGNYAAAASAEPRFSIHDLNTGKEVRTITGHTAAVTALAFARNSKLVLSGSADGSARLWEIDTGRQVRALSSPTPVIGSIAFTPDDKKVIIAGGTLTQRLKFRKSAGRSTVFVLDAETGKLLERWDDHPDLVTAIRVTPDGRRMIAVVGNVLRVAAFQNAGQDKAASSSKR